MAVYTVYEPPIFDLWSDEMDKVQFIREGMSIAALLIPPLWLLRHRMWLVFLLYVLFVILAQISFLYFPISVVSGIVFCLSILFALEGNQLRRWTLSRKGWQFVGIVSARNLDECESKFFSSKLQPLNSKSDVSSDTIEHDMKSQSVTDSPRTHNEIVGLFPTPVIER